MNSLKRVFSTKSRQPTGSPPNRAPMIVKDPAEIARTRQMEKCYDCTALYELWDCGHQYETARNLCDQHVSTLIWEVNYNYDPEIFRMAGKCRACKERDAYVAKLNKFLEIRNQKVKHYDHEVNWEANILNEVKRMRDLSQADFDAEVKAREEGLIEKMRIRGLDRDQADREIAMMRASIDRWVPPETGGPAQGQPPHGSRSLRR